MYSHYRFQGKHLTQVLVSARSFLAAIPLSSDPVQLFIVPRRALEPTAMAQTFLLIRAEFGGQFYSDKTPASIELGKSWYNEAKNDYFEQGIR